MFPHCPNRLPVVQYFEMPTTQTTTDDTATDGSQYLPLRIPEVEELCDRFMEQVDPRFTRAGQPQLMRDLAAASPAEKYKLVESYQLALRGFDIWADTYFRELKAAVGKYRRSVEEEHEEEGLSVVEAALDTTSSR